MKKLNKKGVTLIELIVSFAIVSIAMIYFYQTIVDLHRMYKNSNKATDEFVNKDYALRVLDAYIDENGVNNLTSSVCDNYLLGYCSNVEVTNDGVFSKVELKKGTDVLATSYYYTEDKIVAAIESTALDSNGNVKSLSDLKDAVEKQVSGTEKDNYSYEQGIENGKVKYEVKYNDNTIYKKLEEQTIEEQLSGNTSKTLVDDLLKSKNDKWKSSKNNNVYYDETDNNYYLTYNVVDAADNMIAENVIRYQELEKLTTLKASNENQINKEYSLNYNVQPSGILEETASDKYLLKYEVSAEKETTTGTSFKDKCIISIIQDSSNKMVEVFFDNQGIKYKGISEGLSFNKDETIKYEKNNQKSYITFYKVKFYEYNYKNYEKNDICKIKLVEAYKYK